MEEILHIYKKHKFYFNLYAFLFSFGLGLNLFFSKGEILIYLNQFRGELFGQSIKYITMFGEAPMYLFLAAIFLFIRMRTTVAIGLTGLIGLITSFLLKQLYANPRPRTFFKDTEIWDQLSWVGGAYPVSGAFTSYPSGHTLSAFALFGLFALIYQNKLIYILMLFLSFLVAFSRVYLMHHFYMDVLAGSLVGIFLSTFIYHICNFDQVGDKNLLQFLKANKTT